MFSPLSEFIADYTPSSSFSSSISSSSSPSSIKTIMISDGVGCDADFLVNHFLHAFVKAEAPTVFLHLAQTFSHYNLVGSKCGVNLQTAIEKKLLSAIDGMKLLSEALTPSSASDETPLTRILFDAVIETVNAVVGNVDSSPPHPPHNPPLILIDLSLLSGLGVSHRDVIAFVHSLRRRFASLSATLLFRLHGDIEDEEDVDEDDIHLVKLFSHQVDAHFRVRGLSTGYCKDVHGAIELYRRVSSGSNANGQMTFVKNIKKQFKISDKGVAVFAPGLSAAVL